MTSFGEFIAKHRKKLNLTQKQIATGIKQDDGKPISVSISTTLSTAGVARLPITLSCSLQNFCACSSTYSIFVQSACRPTSAKGRFLTSKQPQPTARFARNSADRKNLKNILHTLVPVHPRDITALQHGLLHLCLQIWQTA